MSMVRHSRKSVTCKYCDRREFRWYHDTESGRITKICDKATCDGQGRAQNWVLVRTDTAEGSYVRHQGRVQGCQDVIYIPGSGDGDDREATSDETSDGPTEPEPKPESEVRFIDDETHEFAPSKSDNGNGDPTDKLRDALTALMGSGQVDSETVRTIVKEELTEQQQPTRVIVHDVESATDRELPGLSHQVTPKVLKLLDKGKNVWLVGPAGTGKSTIGHQCAESLSLSFHSISLSPNTSMTEIVGYRDANGIYHETEFRKAYEHGGVFLFDEVDNGHPSAIAKINMALSNGSMAFPDGMVSRNPKFRCLAAANTYGTGPDRAYVGRMQLDAATLDRFTMVRVDIDEALEEQIAHAQGASRETTDRILRFVRHCRRKGEEHGLPVVISPRASMGMALTLNDDSFTWQEAVDMDLRKGVSDNDWVKITEGWAG